MKFADYQFVGMMGYVLIFTVAVFGSAIVFVRLRRERAPVTFKLLRSPGESLRQRVADYDENAVFHFFGAAFAPILLGCGILYALATLRPTMPLWTGLGITASCVIPCMVATGYWSVKKLLRYRNERLGYFGEREVAEHLAPLLSRGYRVFHDVPATNRDKPFNLDHVTVGRTGVALIETKTRRKGRARPGFKDHVVTYDGQKLIWPWAEDTFGLEQASAEAEWLKKFIQQRTGIDIAVKPILALPGWWVESKARGTVVVVNSKSVASAVEGKGGTTLTEVQVDLIARQLDERCRDVSY